MLAGQRQRRTVHRLVAPTIPAVTMGLHLVGPRQGEEPPGRVVNAAHRLRIHPVTGNHEEAHVLARLPDRLHHGVTPWAGLERSRQVHQRHT